jgi:DNA-binding XRE family transcriptional regulator
MIVLSEGLMDNAKRKRLEDAGWAIGSAADFLDLSADEAAFIELKLALSKELRARREDQGLSQTALAKKLGSSQSRLAKMEAGDPSVSVDLLIRGLLAAGASRKEIASAIAPKPARRTRPTAAKHRANAKS